MKRGFPISLIRGGREKGRALPKKDDGPWNKRENRRGDCRGAGFTTIKNGERGGEKGWPVRAEKGRDHHSAALKLRGDLPERREVCSGGSQAEMVVDWRRKKFWKTRRLTREGRQPLR